MKEDKKWYHQSVVYHIYPLSYKDTNNDGMGDLNGIIDSLHYLNDGTENSLGIKAIWLSSIYKSPMADFGYDVSDYYDINPIFGSLDDFDRLIEEAHKRGIKIITDFVINHTSKEHPWFLESRSSLNNPKRHWYIWRDPKPDGSPPNNWVSVFGGPAWTYDEHTKQYYFHSFLPEQPDLNWRDESVRNEVMNVARFWMKRGVDGFRIDALDNLIEDSYLRDDPNNPNYGKEDDSYQSVNHMFSKRQSEVVYCLNTLCDTVGEFEDKFVVSESYLGIAGMVNMFRACDKNIHSPFNFNFIGREWSAKSFKQFVDNFEKSITPNDWPNYVLGNHDRPRLRDRIGTERLKTAALLILTLRGMPFIYYGDEIGMKNAEVRKTEIKDTFALRTNSKFNRDPERSPMQWNGDTNAGFSMVTPWIPISSDYKEINVELESKKPESLLNLYKKIINYRNNSKALMYGSYKSLNTKSPDIYSYVREYEGEMVLMMINFSDKTVKEKLPFDSAKIIVNISEPSSKEEVSGEIELKPNGGYIFEINSLSSN